MSGNLHISSETVNELQPFYSASHFTMAVVIIYNPSVLPVLSSHNNNTPTTTQEANVCFQSSQVCTQCTQNMHTQSAMY